MSQRINITVVGFGNIGVNLIQLLIHGPVRGLNINVVEIDENQHGAFLDLSHGAAIYRDVELTWNNDRRLKNADYVFHCAGASVPKGASRLSIAEKSKEITSAIFEGVSFEKHPFIIVVVNPVEVIALHTYKVTGVSSNRIIGTGTFIDQLRFEYFLSQSFQLDLDHVNASVLGEHGDHQVLISSDSHVNNRPISSLFDEDKLTEVFERSRNAAHEIKETQGATKYAPSAIANYIFLQLEGVYRHEFPASIYIPEHYKVLLGVEDIFFSVPVIVRNGHVYAVEDKLFSEEEVVQLQKAAEAIKSHS